MNIKINKPQSSVTEVGFHQKKGRDYLGYSWGKKIILASYLGGRGNPGIWSTDLLINTGNSY